MHVLSWKYRLYDGKVALSLLHPRDCALHAMGLTQSFPRVPHTMPTESKIENLNWASLQGTMLGDAYLLERLASADESTASFVTRTGGERSSRALARIVMTDGEAGECQMQVWQVLKKSEHPNLLPIWGTGRVWGTGRAHAEGHDLIYVVVEAADENLGGVLADRALEPGEAGEVLVSLVGALGHLHSQGFVHGSLSPEQVLAVGETVKLSIGGARRIRSTEKPDIHRAKYRAPESDQGNVTPAADIWCLGATLVEVLTKHPYGDGGADEAAKLPAPFDAIAMSCLQADPEARGTLTHILNLHEGGADQATLTRSAPKQMAAAAGAGSGGNSTFVFPLEAAGTARAVEPEIEHAPTVPVYVAPEPIVPEAEAFSAEAFSVTPAAPSEDERSVAEPIAPVRDLPVEWRNTGATRPAENAPAQQEAIARAKRRAWIFVAIALAILLAVIWALRPARPGSNRVLGQQKTSSPVAVAKHGQTMTLPAAGQNGSATAPVTARTPAVPSNVAPNVARGSATQATSAAGRGPVWRVILYTYNRAADAGKRAAAINAKHPSLDAQVFMPNGEGHAPYLVTIGGSTNREDAAQIRRTAIRSGLPRDAYLQNYSR